jgi:hypothetical protein
LLPQLQSVPSGASITAAWDVTSICGRTLLDEMTGEVAGNTGAAGGLRDNTPIITAARSAKTSKVQRIFVIVSMRSLPILADVIGLQSKFRFVSITA